MELTGRALVDDDEACTYLGISADDKADSHELVVSLINQISAAIESRTDRNFRKASYTEIVNGTGRSIMWLKYTPVVTTTLVVYFYDGEEWDNVSESPYSLTPEYDLETGQVWFDERGQTFPVGTKNIKFVYDAGYDGVSNIPFNIKLATLKLIGMYRKQADGDLHGMKSQMMDGMTTSFALDEWPKDVMNLLGLRKKLCI